jgi:hypothetical protein
MLRVFHALSTLLLVSAIGVFLFNLIFQFATTGSIEILSIQELWTTYDKQSFENTKVFALSFLPGTLWDLIAAAPAATALLIIAGIFYVPARIMMFVSKLQEKKDYR